MADTINLTDLVARVRLDTSHLAGDVSSVEQQTKGIGGRLAGGITSGVKVAALGAAGAVAVLGAAVSKGAADSAGMNRILTQSQAAIASTGGAAGVTRAHIDALSDSIEKSTGVEQEGVAQGENLLLTFTNIRNGVGKGNDVFDQATKTLTDMSVALGTDVPASAIQLGKALNDPTKGLTALTRVGVTFTAAQTKQIKSMQAAGDVAGAQKVILGELNREFGGSAKAAGQTLPGAFARLQAVAGDALETLATPVLPVLQSAIEALMPVVKGLQPAFNVLGGALAGVGAAIAHALVPAMPIVAQLVGALGTTLAHTLAALAPAVGPLLGAFLGLARAISPLLPLLAQLVATALGALLPALTPVINALAQVVGAFAPVFPIVGKLVKVLASVLAPVLAALAPAFVALIGAVLPLLPPLVQLITVVTPLITLVGTLAAGLVKLATGVITTTVVPALVYLLDKAKPVFAGLVGAAGTMTAALLTGFRLILDAAMSALGGIVHAAAGAFGWVPGVGGRLKAASAAFDAMRGKIDGTLKQMTADAQAWGRDTAAGLAQGINTNTGMAVAAAQHLASQVHITVAQALRIQSPSKVMRGLGRYVSQGFAKGIGEDAGTVRDHLHQLVQLIHQAFPKNAPSALLDWLGQERRRLVDEVAKRDALADQLAKAQDKLRGLRQARAQEVGTVKQTFTSLGNVTGIAGDLTQAGKKVTAGGIIARLRQTVARAADFAQMLAQLRRRGLDPRVVQQIAEAGPVDGYDAARALLAGSQRDVRTLNSLEHQLAAQGAAAGRTAGDALYSNGIQMAEGLVRGFRSRLQAVRDAMADIAATIVRVVKEKLGIHSPSRVFHGLGAQVSAGFANGIRAASGHARAAMDHLVQVPAPQLVGAVAGAGAGGGGLHIGHLHWHAGDGSSPGDLLSALTWLGRTRF